jgi:hypothetical protein
MSSITISKIPVHKAYFFHQWERPVLLTVLLSLISMQGYMKCKNIVMAGFVTQPFATI